MSAEVGAPFATPVSALEVAATTIREAILSGELKAGDKIGQALVADRAGISRVPVREALRELSGQGIIGYEPRRGYHVHNLSESDFREIYLMRGLLEDELLRQAWNSVDEHLVSRLSMLQQRISDAASSLDYLAFAHAQKAFQFAIFDRAQLPRMLSTVNQLWDAADVYRAIFLRSNDGLMSVNSEHARILEACRRNDLDAAVGEFDKMRSLVVGRINTILTND